MTDSTIARPASYRRPQVKVSEERKQEILAGMSSGEFGLIEGTELLGLPDAGWTLDLLREAGMWLFTLDRAEIERQVEEGREALRACLKPEIRAALEAKRYGKI
ncbi:hypothetical protein LPN04_01795 [Rugamonas sp. A1-17]|nr:hypothetical protein [Rugamonas sp. A1-17]